MSAIDTTTRVHLAPGSDPLVLAMSSAGSVWCALRVETDLNTLVIFAEHPDTIVAELRRWISVAQAWADNRPTTTDPPEPETEVGAS